MDGFWNCLVHCHLYYTMMEATPMVMTPTTTETCMSELIHKHREAMWTLQWISNREIREPSEMGGHWEPPTAP